MLASSSIAIDVCCSKFREQRSVTCCLGVIILLQAALDVITGLLPWTGLPNIPVLDQFVKCLCSLLELLVSVAERLPAHGRYW